MILIKKGLNILPSLIPLYELHRRCAAADGFAVKIYWHLLAQRLCEDDNEWDYLAYENNQLIASLHAYLFIDSVQISLMTIPQLNNTKIINKLLTKALNYLHSKNAVKCILICNYNDKILNHRFTLWGGQQKFNVKELQAPLMLPMNQTELLLTVESATIEDIDVLLDISKACFNYSYQDQLRLKYQDDLKNNQRHIYLARNAENEIIGKLHVREDERQVILHELGILPKFQNQGFGRSLITQWLQGNAIRYNGKPIIVEVLNNNTAAVALYRACGFIENDSYNYYEFDITYLRAMLVSV